MTKRFEVKPLDEYCVTCGAEPGVGCERPPGCVGGFCDERWRYAAETREGNEEDRLERRRDTMADERCARGGPV